MCTTYNINGYVHSFKDKIQKWNTLETLRRSIIRVLLFISNMKIVIKLHNYRVVCPKVGIILFFFLRVYVWNIWLAVTKQSVKYTIFSCQLESRPYATRPKKCYPCHNMSKCHSKCQSHEIIKKLWNIYALQLANWKIFWSIFVQKFTEYSVESMATHCGGM